MRAPSSFHSTEQRPRSSIAVGGICRRGCKHRAQRAHHLETDELECVPAAIKRGTAVRPRSPHNISARRTERPVTAAALATPSATRPSLAPCRSSPSSSRLTNSASASLALVTTLRAAQRARTQTLAPNSPPGHRSQRSDPPRSATHRSGGKSAAPALAHRAASPSPHRFAPAEVHQPGTRQPDPLRRSRRDKQFGECSRLLLARPRGGNRG